MVKVSVKFGLLGAAVNIVIFLVYFFLGYNPLLEMGALDIFILPVFLFFGVKEYRDVVNGRLLDFWQGMTVGFIIYSFIAVIFAMFIWLFLEIDTALVEEYISDRLHKTHESKEMIIDKMGQGAFDDTVREIGNMTISDLVLDGLFKKAGIGFLLTSLITVVMKRKDKN